MQNFRNKVRNWLRGTVHRRAFTLIELLTVIAIIGILASFLMPALRRARIKAMEAKAKSMIASLQIALSMYETDYGVYPQSATTGGAQVNGNSKSSFISGYNNLVKALSATTGGGSYMEFKKDDLDENDASRPVLLDPWGRAYIYVSQKWWNGSSWVDVFANRGPFWPNNITDKSSNSYNIYSLGVDGKTNGGVSYSGVSDWNLSTMYDNPEDGYKDGVASSSPRYDDINSWE